MSHGHVQWLEKRDGGMGECLEPKILHGNIFGFSYFLMYIYGVSVVEGYELVYEIAFEVV